MLSVLVFIITNWWLRFLSFYIFFLTIISPLLNFHGHRGWLELFLNYFLNYLSNYKGVIKCEKTSRLRTTCQDVLPCPCLYIILSMQLGLKRIYFSPNYSKFINRKGIREWYLWCPIHSHVQWDVVLYLFIFVSILNS